MQGHSSVCAWHRSPGGGDVPPLIFLNRLGMFSSSKGRLPQSRAKRMTPQDQTSTSGPAYSRPLITSAAGSRWAGLQGASDLECRHECVAALQLI